MAEQLGEKTEDPTSKKYADARERGQVAKSADLSAFVVMGGATLSCLIFGGLLFREATLVTAFLLAPDVMGTDLAGGRLVADLEGVGERIGLALGMFMLLMALFGAVGQFTQVGLAWSPKAIGLKLEKLNPVKGFARLFSKKSAVKAALDVGKLLVLGAVASLVMHGRWEELLAIGALPLMEALSRCVAIMVELAAWVLLAMLLLGLMDLMYQKHQHKEDLKMTKQEVKDERKNTDGDMEMKQRRQRMAREIAMQRLGVDVPQADVVVTNPTHYAVALKYEKGEMHAPKVTAKGADYLALRIRQLATGAGVPIVERPPLARALYAQVRVGQEIDEGHYEAVAEVLAYVYRLDRERAQEAVGV